MPDTDDIRDACEAYLSQKQCTLWADWDITRPDRREKAVDWLAGEIQAVADFYEPEPFNYDAIQSGMEHDVHVEIQSQFLSTRRTQPHYGRPVDAYSGPYSAERNGGGQRPSALITHGQQAETW